MYLESMALGSGGAGGAAAPPEFFQGGIAPPAIFFGMIYLQYIYKIITFLSQNHIKLPLEALFLFFFIQK